MNLLIRKAKKRDKAAFQELMEEQTRAMYKVAKAILKNDEDVADAMQDTVLACWEKIDTLQKDKYCRRGGARGGIPGGRICERGVGAVLKLSR